MDLLLAPAGAGIVLVEAREIAVIALVQGLVRDGLQIRLADLFQHQLAGALGPREVGGEGDVELHAHLLQAPAGIACLLDAEIGEARILPAGEQVLQVPFALAVADEHKKAVHVSASPFRFPPPCGEG